MSHELEDIQCWMQAAITNSRGVQDGLESPEARRHIDVGPDEIERLLTRSARLTAIERLAIYGSAYYARLLDCLREEFPVLKHALGDEVFDAFAAGYLQQYPSRSYTLFDLGKNFARFLQETRPALDANDGPTDWADFLIDLTALERTFNEVFDGPGVEGQSLLDPKMLASISADSLSDARLIPVCCFRLASFRYPVHSYFTAVRRGKEPAPPEPAETHLAITRRWYVVRHYELSQPAYELLNALIAGDPLGQAIGRIIDSAGANADRLESDLRTWFHDWAAEGFFLQIEVPS